jgi:poly(3-hydroxybutyrate) depolymerase
VVAAPSFFLADQALSGANLDENDLPNEPADISFVITRVLAALPGVADPNRIGVAGHSDGGQAAFSVGFEQGSADPRIRGVMSMSIQPMNTPAVYPYGPRPVLVAQGDQDTINPPNLGIGALTTGVA